MCRHHPSLVTASRCRPLFAVVAMLLLAQGTLARVIGPCIEAVASGTGTAASRAAHAHGAHDSAAAGHVAHPAPSPASGECDAESGQACSPSEDAGACVSMPACASVFVPADAPMLALAPRAGRELPEPPALARAPAPRPDVPPPRA